MPILQKKPFNPLRPDGPRYCFLCADFSSGPLCCIGNSTCKKWRPRGDRKCPRCDGKGEIYHDAHGAKIFDQTRECPDCNGTGKIGGD